MSPTKAIKQLEDLKRIMITTKLLNSLVVNYAERTQRDISDEFDSIMKKNIESESECELEKEIKKMGLDITNFDRSHLKKIEEEVLRKLR